MKFNYLSRDNQSKSQWKNSDQVSYPASTGKKWIKLSGPMTYIYINKCIPRLRFSHSVIDTINW